MASRISRAEYYYAVVEDQPGEGYKLLSVLANLGVNLLAFTTVPVGPTRTQLTLFPQDKHKLTDAASKAGLSLDGPHPALLVQGDDELGVLAGIHEKLYQAGVNVYASSAVTDGKGNFGYIVYVRPEQYQQAATALGV